jgi:catechol 2,3-dioxygenase-like lactoylglutathione lyase family enzyme
LHLQILQTYVFRSLSEDISMPSATDVKLSRLGYVILYVKDTTKSLPFYRDTLGMKVLKEEEGWVEFESGETTVCLHGDKELKSNHQERTSLCFNIEDIKGAYEALKAKGVKFDKEPHVVCQADGKTGLSADFHDPDRNSLSIFGFAK